ncbi:MAG: hypothetical protein ACKVS9_15085 [Phycisphaerae bacterium]
MWTQKMRAMAATAIVGSSLAQTSSAAVTFDVVALPGPVAVAGTFSALDMTTGAMEQFAGRMFRPTPVTWFGGGTASRLVAGFNGTPTMRLTQMNVAPNILSLRPAGAVQVTFDYRDTGSPINLYVQTTAGALWQVVPDFPMIAPTAFPGVIVNHTFTAVGPGFIEGSVTISFAGAMIQRVQIGGQNLEIDNVSIL